MYKQPKELKMNKKELVQIVIRLHDIAFTNFDNLLSDKSIPVNDIRLAQAAKTWRAIQSLASYYKIQIGS